ncbi:hypothetical protein BV898_16570 [Hypsibius exemplaris]|uniref:Uncharacterized protein n=1 Tax=Hypsibius exemplaris TaxID=2072580 RepID=A0A9X6NFK8_HYPEX|nr:hypothetical protein BV898_16570 [Hypsibius exemplaris]
MTDVQMLLNCVICLHLTISGIVGYDRRGVSIISVIIGDNPGYGYFAQESSQQYDVALARHCGRSRPL